MHVCVRMCTFFCFPYCAHSLGCVHVSGCGSANVLSCVCVCVQMMSLYLKVSKFNIKRLYMNDLLFRKFNPRGVGAIHFKSYFSSVCS